MKRIRGPVSYHDFRQRVRRYRRTEVLRQVAVWSAGLERGGPFLGGPGKNRTPIQPFTLAGIARAAIVYANEHRPDGFAVRDLLELCDCFSQLEDPILAETLGEIRWQGLMERLLYQQAHFKYPVREDAGRSIPLFVDQPNVGGFATDPLTSVEWDGLLNTSLENFMLIGLVLGAGALSSGGEISFKQLEEAATAGVFGPLTIGEVRSVIDSMFASTLEELKEAGRWTGRDDLEGYSFNPLIAKPLIKLEDSYLVPVPRFVIDKFCPTGLYFIAVKKFGSRFTESLGELFQNYIGDQLRTIEGWSVFDEVQYGTNLARSVDYFVRTEQSLVLIEVKAARPIEAHRLGELQAESDTQKKVGYAAKQIEQTAARLADTPELAEINPEGLPVYGLVVTLERFHLVDGIGSSSVEAGSVPTVVVAAQDLEQFIGAVSGRDDAAQCLDRAFESNERPSLQSFRHSTRGLEPKPNRILDSAWDRFSGPLTAAYSSFSGSSIHSH